MSFTTQSPTSQPPPKNGSESTRPRINVIWRPQIGPQHALVTCPVQEVFFGGARGGGKTDGVLGKWALKEKRYGQHFNAIMFRRTTVSSEDAIERAKELYLPLGAKFVGSPIPRFRMAHGGRVAFAYLDSVGDAQEYQGRNVTDAWIEEAGQYPDPAPIDRLFGVLRSAHGVPVQIILTANPGGAGQGWIRDRYQLVPFPKGPRLLKREHNGVTVNMAVIPSRITDNRILLHADPGYVERLHLVGGRKLVQAWVDGDWNAIEGAFFDEWDEKRHVLDPFDIPEHWLRFRSMDWGSARPFSVGWWAIASDDTGRIPRGAMVRYREWYGCVPGQHNTGLKLSADVVAAGISERDGKEPIQYGVLDPAAFAEDGGPSIGERINRALKQGRFRPADNKRVSQRGAMGGWDAMRGRLAGDDKPMLFVTRDCKAFIRTVPLLQHDLDKPEDLDCWVAGTLVDTPSGPRPIEQIYPGDLVDTPLGPRPALRCYVSGAGATVVVTLADGRVLKGTPHHKIYVKGKGLIPLSELVCHDILKERITWSRSLNTVVSFIGAIKGASIIIRVVAASVFTAKHGWMSGTRFQPAGMSTISTETTTTTISQIFSVFRRRSMSGSTFVNVSLASLDKSSRHGVALILERQRSEITQGKCGHERRNENVRAHIVDVLLGQDTLVRRFAHMSAVRGAMRLFRRLVKYAARHFGRNGTQRSKLEPARIVAVGRCEERTPVYNLTVDRAHMFYANGVLSSNTEAEDHVADEARYACMSRPWVRSSRPAEKPKTDGWDKAFGSSDGGQNWKTV